MSIHGDVHFIKQLKYKTHVAVTAKFTLLHSFSYYLEKVCQLGNSFMEAISKLFPLDGALFFAT